MQDISLRLERLLFNLDTLAELGEELTSPKDFHRIVRSSLYMIMGTFSTSKGAIFQFDQKEKIVQPMVSKGVGNINDLVIRLSEGAVRELINIKTPIDLNTDEKATTLFGAEKAVLEKIRATVLIPLVVRDDFLGFVSIGKKFSGEAYTKGHSYRVSTYCAAIADEMMWSQNEVEGIRIAGLLHDIGKIAIDKTIINKDRALTRSELVELNSHPSISYEILTKVKFPWAGISKMARSHHERVDGRGYPDGLKGDEIPSGSKIMSLADSFDAMTTDRPYRPELTARDVLSELKENGGKQFDPHVLQSFFYIIRKEIVGEKRPVIIPLLNESLANELKREVLNSSFNFSYNIKNIEGAAG